MSFPASHVIPTPVPNPETEAFWAAANEGRLLLRRCSTCNKVHYYPRSLCPHCYGATVWEEASGQGHIYSFSVVRWGAAPYVIAFVALAEGVSMMTNIVDCDVDSLRIDQPVHLVFKPSESGQLVPMFTP
jgi:uncharacterized OB-fold protein